MLTHANSIGGVMFSVLALNVVDHGFESCVRCKFIIMSITGCADLVYFDNNLNYL
jgi:hypothetical protein